MNIYLCGFMGSGKTTLRESLQQQLKKDGFDFDVEIARRAGFKAQELGDYIESIGWDKFRLLERSLLEETLRDFEDGLFSFGGGTLTAPGVREIINENHCKVLWLSTSVEQCWERVKGEKYRPLVKKGKEEFFSLYQKRLKDYEVFEKVEKDTFLI